MSTTPRAYRRRIGEILVSDGIVTQEQIDEALAVQKRTGELLGAILMDMGVVSESDIAKTLCVQYQLPFISLVNYQFDDKMVQLLPKEFLHRHKLLPFDRVGDMLLIMVTEIPPDTVLAEIPKLTQLNAALYVGYYSEVQQQLSRTAPLEEAAKASPAKGSAGKAAHKPAPMPEVLDVATQLITISGEESGEDSAGLDLEESPADKATTTIVFGQGKQNFLEELDSTWDSIFDPATGKDEAARVKPAK